MNYVIGGVLISLIYVFSRDILSLFLTSQTTIEIAHSLVMITLWSYLIFGHAQIISATMRASGTVLLPTVIGCFNLACRSTRSILSFLPYKSWNRRHLDRVSSSIYCQLNITVCIL